ncbi:hypothetical protein CYMTET_6592 [Cymbomonas tetramitiformis]|uniref:Uncharacterized protein n=1 Tax=Cymbomonas tetramitiformis TaxID=36881 RepID=A0AAE0GYN4_9CHLO|nr:hypothetical protein CYMTET_6592 [Cymbomonas tetramitiformis]
MDMDAVVSAFQTVFDDEDDEDDEQFAELCQQHDRPLVREDPDPFTYPKGHDIGLRAHYAGVVRGSTDTDMGDGAPADLHLGTLSVPRVVCDGPPPANEEIDAQPLRPVLLSDPAAYQSPFELTFMDRFHPACPDNPSLNVCSLEFTQAHVHAAELSVIDEDSNSDISSCHGDVLPSAPPATSTRVEIFLALDCALICHP